MRSRVWKVAVALIFILQVTPLSAQENKHVYPRVAGYVGIIHPLATFSSENPVWNFDGAYVIGCPQASTYGRVVRLAFRWSLFLLYALTIKPANE